MQNLPVSLVALSQLEAIQPIRQAFINAGVPLFLVGGCVRDALLESPNEDWDFTTPASPNQIRAICQHVGAAYAVGEKFGTVGIAVRASGGQILKFEITTHRTDTYSESSRKPEVQATHDIALDLARRDFTINALALNIASTVELVDPFNGLGGLGLDTGLVTLRTPVDAVQTLSEDPLRILRLIRFAARYQLSRQVAIDPSLAAACTQLIHRLNLVSSERISAELRKIIEGHTGALALELTRQLGITSDIFGGVANGRLFPAFWQHESRAWARFLANMASQLDAELVPGKQANIAKTFKLTRADTKRALNVVSAMRDLDTHAIEVADLVRIARKRTLPVLEDAVGLRAQLQSVDAGLAQKLTSVLNQRVHTIHSVLPVSGHELVAAGLSGAAIGTALAQIEVAFCQNPQITKIQALQLVGL